MFTGFTENTIQFFLDLKFHNNATYFHENHERYVEDVQRVFYEMIEDLAPDMLKIDPKFEIRPYKCLSRLHRDTRFSRLFSKFLSGIFCMPGNQGKNPCFTILSWVLTALAGEWDSGTKTGRRSIFSGKECWQILTEQWL